MSRTVPATRLLSLPRAARVRAPTSGDTLGDFTSAFRFSHSRPRAPRLPEDTAEQLERAKEEVATLPKPMLPGGRQSFPKQEKGRRPHV
ncbi:hypothetical protein ACWIID_16600 [Streptomyces phaeochromogenes]